MKRCQANITGAVRANPADANAWIESHMFAIRDCYCEDDIVILETEAID